ncbi:hypothetical protein PAXINDRAFT_176538 [Paxillus involutus ATCC 200175]|uniref:DUF7330 domain-containing protein n=1 Tax=Paxillus involutus ATCC 200175 TaxID=664439 RepID=A0A0C9U8J3_PAXIN|nr:hypothetical protein PAXINDRAFT_176538 [Paxillus involutus ATCC 200175]
MIISEQDLKPEISKLAEVEWERAKGFAELQDDLPPAYGDHDQDASVPSRSSATTPHNILAQHGVKPTNYLTLIERDSAIRGTYIIDPHLYIPAHLLPPLVSGQTEEDRKNLYLHTRDGTVDINIWLVSPTANRDTKSPPPNKRTTMKVSSNDGSVTVRVNAVDYIDPFLLDVFSRDGRVTVLIPQSFHGPLHLKARDGGHALSDGVLRNSTSLGTAEGTVRYFVGDFSAASEPRWESDELRVESRDGKIRVRYVDEIETTSTKGGFFSRMFSM